MNKKIMASVLIIGQNSEKILRRCLDSLVNFQEVVFIDGGSTDKTESIARTYPNVKFIYNKWPGFIPQRNISIDHATLDWCFMIDSDEKLTPELEAEIRSIVEKNDHSTVLYRVVRTEYFEGKAIESGHGRSDYQERLFLRSRVRYTGGNHHEHLIDGKPTKEVPYLIKNINPKLRVLHDPDYRYEDMVTKLPRFTLLIGAEKFKKGRNVSFIEIIFTFVWTTIRLSWKSRKMGSQGLILALMKAYNDSLAKTYIYVLQNFRKDQTDKIDRKYLG